MSIITQVQTIINNFPGISDFSNGINIDYTTHTPGDFGLFSNGETITRKFINGREQRRHSFTLFATNQAINDYDRLTQSEFLINLSDYLRSQENTEFEGGVIEKIECANGMIFSVPSGDYENGCTYQLQINVTYKTE